jgi:hypothetical protein
MVCLWIMGGTALRCPCENVWWRRSTRQRIIIKVRKVPTFLPQKCRRSIIIQVSICKESSFGNVLEGLEDHPAYQRRPDLFFQLQGHFRFLVSYPGSNKRGRGFFCSVSRCARDDIHRFWISHDLYAKVSFGRFFLTKIAAKLLLLQIRIRWRWVQLYPSGFGHSVVNSTPWLLRNAGK